MHRHAHRVLKTDPVMAALIEAAGPCRIKSREQQEPFQALARAIAHQQLNGIAAESILRRFVALFESSSFPSPEQVLEIPDQKLRAVGFSRAKVAALKDLARKTIEGVVPPSAERAWYRSLDSGNDADVPAQAPRRAAGR
jgi:DNA-3-methyladenine glycosylase II